MADSTDSAQVPLHLGIIPDGNRRWAKDNGLPSLEGHRKGLAVSREIALAALDRGVKTFTMFAFSTENWKRTQEEVGYLMDLFYSLVTKEYQQFIDKGVRFRLSGRREGLSPKLLKAINDTEAKTAGLTNGTMVLCINYGGQQELADAAAGLVRAGVAAEAVTPERMAAELYVPDVPPIDLVIRTSGEQRLSGFMLWQAAYAEFYFVQQHWPDFSVADLDAAFAEFARRGRRFGA